MQYTTPTLNMREQTLAFFAGDDSAEPVALTLGSDTNEGVTDEDPDITETLTFGADLIGREMVCVDTTTDASVRLTIRIGIVVTDERPGDFCADGKIVTFAVPPPFTLTSAVVAPDVLASTASVFFSGLPAFLITTELLATFEALVSAATIPDVSMGAVASGGITTNCGWAVRLLASSADTSRYWTSPSADCGSADMAVAVPSSPNMYETIPSADPAAVWSAE